MAIIGGARTVGGVTKVVRNGFMPLMKVCASFPWSDIGSLLRLVGDLYQLAAGASICAELPSTGGTSINLGISCCVSS